MYIDFNGSKIYYDFHRGNKTLLVFLHGWGGSSNLMKPLASKFENLEDFSILTIDFPPFGRSEEPKEIWDLNSYISLVSTLLLAINSSEIEKVIFICHSFGGRVGIKLLSSTFENKELSNLVEKSKLILLSSAGIKAKFSLKTKIKVLKYKFYKKIKSQKMKNFGSSDYKVLSPIMKGTFNKIINEDLAQNCKKIKNKTLIIFGDKDKETPLYMGKEMNKKIKNSSLLVIKNGDHFCYLSQINNIFPTLYYFVCLS